MTKSNRIKGRLKYQRAVILAAMAFASALSPQLNADSSLNDETMLTAIQSYGGLQSKALKSLMKTLKAEGFKEMRAILRREPNPHADTDRVFVTFLFEKSWIEAGQHWEQIANIQLDGYCGFIREFKQIHCSLGAISFDGGRASTNTVQWPTSI